MGPVASPSSGAAAVKEAETVHGQVVRKRNNVPIKLNRVDARR